MFVTIMSNAVDDIPMGRSSSDIRTDQQGNRGCLAGNLEAAYESTACRVPGQLIKRFGRLEMLSGNHGLDESRGTRTGLRKLNCHLEAARKRLAELILVINEIAQLAVKLANASNGELWRQTER